MNPIAKVKNISNALDIEILQYRKPISTMSVFWAINSTAMLESKSTNTNFRFNFPTSFQADYRILHLSADTATMLT